MYGLGERNKSAGLGVLAIRVKKRGVLIVKVMCSEEGEALALIVLG